MSDRHVHITSFLYADPDPGALRLFQTVARQHFEPVTPVRVSVKAWDHGDPDALVLYSKDGGNGDDWIYTLPRAVEALSGSSSVMWRSCRRGRVPRWRGGRGSGMSLAGAVLQEPRVRRLSATGSLCRRSLLLVSGPDHARRVIRS